MNSLGRAAQPLIPELERWDIKVYMIEWRVVWRDTTVQFKPHTPRAICSRELKKLIKRARAKHISDHQTGLPL